MLSAKISHLISYSNAIKSIFHPLEPEREPEWTDYMKGLSLREGEQRAGGLARTREKYCKSRIKRDETLERK